MYKKILAPLDGSELSECTLEHIKAVATGCQVPDVVLLHIVVPIDESGMHYRHRGLTEEEMEETRKNAMDYLNKVGETLSSRGATVTTRVAIGGTSEKIIEAAEEINADLIAMSTHGRSGLSRWAFGSVTDKVLRRARNVPILTVKAKEQK